MHTYLGIETRKIAATDRKPARVVATCSECKHRVVVDADDWQNPSAADGAANRHRIAAQFHANYHAACERSLPGAHAYVIEATIGDPIRTRSGYVFALNMHRELRAGFRAA